MADPSDPALRTHFAALTDPRVERTKLHPLPNVLTIAIGAVICGAESWDDIAAFGEAHVGWLGTFLDLTHGIPSMASPRTIPSIGCSPRSIPPSSKHASWPGCGPSGRRCLPR